MYALLSLKRTTLILPRAMACGIVEEDPTHTNIRIFACCGRTTDAPQVKTLEVGHYSQDHNLINPLQQHISSFICLHRLITNPIKLRTVLGLVKMAMLYLHSNDTDE